MTSIVVGELHPRKALSWNEGNVTSDRISMDASPLTGHCFDKLVAHLPRQFSVFTPVCFFSVRFPGGVHAASPLTSSPNAHDDELGCHRLAAGGGFGRPAQTWTYTHRQGLIHTHTHHTQRPTHCLNLFGQTHRQRLIYTRT